MLAFFFLYWTFGWRPGYSLNIDSPTGGFGMTGDQIAKLWHVTNPTQIAMLAIGGTAIYVLATTMTHGAVMTTQIGNGFAQRTNVQSIFKVGFFSNTFLLWGILVEILMFCALVYIPGLAQVFHHGPINLWPDWAFLLLLVPILLIVDEIRKFFVRRQIAAEAKTAARPGDLARDRSRGGPMTHREPSSCRLLVVAGDDDVDVHDYRGGSVKVIIGGCGRVGAQLAIKLSREGHEVVVIDKDAMTFRRLEKGFNGTTIRGMVFDRDVLEKAGTDRADAYVAVTSGDNSNVVSATIAREIFRVPKVVARIFDPRRAEIYRRLGIQTVSSVTWAANEISSLVLYPALVRDITLGDGEVQLVKISVPPRIVGRTIADITMTGEAMPFAIVRGGKSFIPATHETLHDADIVEVAVLTSAMDRFQNLTNP